MERDNYTCKCCGAYNCEINVHHTNYIPYRMAWEYPNETLVCLCNDCHSELHRKMKNKKIDRYRIGDLYSYIHSDFENYGFIYDMDFLRNIIHFASIDSGGSYDSFYIESFSLNDFSHFSKMNCEVNYWTELIIKNIKDIIENNTNSFYFYNEKIFKNYNYQKQFKNVISFDNDLNKLIKLVNGE